MLFFPTRLSTILATSFRDFSGLNGASLSLSHRWLVVEWIWKAQRSFFMPSQLPIIFNDFLSLRPAADTQAHRLPVFTACRWVCRSLTTEITRGNVRVSLWWGGTRRRFRGWGGRREIKERERKWLKKDVLWFLMLEKFFRSFVLMLSEWNFSVGKKPCEIYAMN